MDSTTARASIVGALCLPSVLATCALWAAATEAAAPTTDLLASVASWLFVVAAYGPVLVIVASVLAVGVARAGRPQRRAVYVSWLAVAAGVLAAVIFHGFVISIVELP